MIGIVDYGLGNIKAVEKALYRLSIPCRILTSGEDNFVDCTHLILPGVGHFATGMENLRSRGYLGTLHKNIMEQKKPALGICLGMQLFALQSEEGNCAGLGYVHRDVVKLDPPDPGARIPHVGWNKMLLCHQSPLLNGIQPDERFYFVHSFGIMSNGESGEIAVLRYFGSDICALLEQENVLGVQFHPEKSHDKGLRILRNFYENYG